MAGAPAFTEADTHRFTAEARRIIAFARVLEWTVRWTGTNKNLAVLRSPNGEKTLNIPITNVNHNRVRSWVKQLITHSSPVSVLNLMEGGFDMVREPDIAQVVTAYGVELSEQIKKWREEDEMKTQTAVAAAMDEAVADAEKRLKVVESVDESPKIVAAVPWLAKRGGKDGGKGRMYESQTVTHLTYSDGTDTYKCNFCEYRNVKPRAVAIHAGRHHEKALGLAPIRQDGQPVEPKKKVSPPTIVVENYEASGFHRGAGQRRLANDIVKALDSIEAWQALSVSDLADAVAEAIVTNRPERAEAEPLSDEEVLRRITSLVDRGRLADMHRQVEQLTESLRVTAEARADAESKADKLQGNLSALRELLADES